MASPTSKHLIYALVDPRSGQWRYIGKSSRGLARPKEHLRPYALKFKTWKNNWVKSLLVLGLKPVVEVVEEFQSAGDLCEAEIEWIAAARAVGCLLTNETDGGDGVPGRVVRSETRELHRANATGKKATTDTRSKMARAHAGRPLSAEHRLKIGRGRLGCKNAKPYDLGARAARSRALGGRPFMDDAGVRYETIRQAASALKIDRAQISGVLHGKYRTAHGRSFSYVEVI